MPERIEFTNTKMIMLETGYLTKENGTWKHFYYLKDHLGNNRRVVNQSGAIVQSLQYEPFGMTFADGINAGWQPYKFGGKEEETDCRLNWYDFESRLYVPDLGRFMQPDPMAEKYYSISPYAYCGNNPVNRIDPDGRREWPVNQTHNNGQRRVTSGYRTENRPNHNGIDIGYGLGNNNAGAPVLATHDGTVTRLATIDSGDTNAGGNRIQITSANGEVSTFYMHLESIAGGLEVGSVVTEGTQLGTLGGSGSGVENSYTPHLHYELNMDGQRVNPETATGLIDPQSRLNPISLPEVTVTAPAPAPVLPQVRVPEVHLPEIRLPENR